MNYYKRDLPKDSLLFYRKIHFKSPSLEAGEFVGHNVCHLATSRRIQDISGWGPINYYPLSVDLIIFNPKLRFRWLGESEFSIGSHIDSVTKFLEPDVIDTNQVEYELKYEHKIQKMILSIDSSNHISRIRFLRLMPEK